MKIHQKALLRNSFASKQNLIHNNDNKRNSKPLKLPLFDRTNRLRPLELDDANIIILGENPSHTLDLSLHIQTYYARKGKLINLISLKEFSNLQTHETNKDFIYVVVGSATELNVPDLTAILTQFTNIFVFSLNGLKLDCSYSCLAHSTPSCDEITFALGGEQILRKHLISTLNDHEFLAITGNGETIRTLSRSKFTRGPRK